MESRDISIPESLKNDPVLSEPMVWQYPTNT
jgi:hypothetical protein